MNPQKQFICFTVFWFLSWAFVMLGIYLVICYSIVTVMFFGSSVLYLIQHSFSVRWGFDRAKRKTYIWSALICVFSSIGFVIMDLHQPKTPLLNPGWPYVWSFWVLVSIVDLRELHQEYRAMQKSLKEPPNV